MLAPLFKEYDSTISSQVLEISSLQLELQKCIDNHQALADENSHLLNDLQVKTREHLKCIEDTRDYPQVENTDDKERI